MSRFFFKKLVLTFTCLFILLVTEWAHLLMPVLSDVKFSWNGITKRTQEQVMKHSKLDRQVHTR